MTREIYYKSLAAPAQLEFDCGAGVICQPWVLKAQSFPRWRESSPSAVHFQRPVPAFVGMTGVSKGNPCQMTPVPRLIESLT